MYLFKCDGNPLAKENPNGVGRLHRLETGGFYSKPPLLPLLLRKKPHTVYGPLHLMTFKGVLEV